MHLLLCSNKNHTYRVYRTHGAEQTKYVIFFWLKLRPLFSPTLVRKRKWIIVISFWTFKTLPHPIHLEYILLWEKLIQKKCSCVVPFTLVSWRNAHRGYQFADNGNGGGKFICVFRQNRRRDDTTFNQRRAPEEESSMIQIMLLYVPAAIDNVFGWCVWLQNDSGQIRVGCPWVQTLGVRAENGIVC